MDIHNGIDPKKDPNNCQILSLVAIKKLPINAKRITEGISLLASHSQVRKKKRSSKFHIPRTNMGAFKENPNNNIIIEPFNANDEPLQLGELGYICQVLQMILVQISTKRPAYMESAVNACRYFLSVHKNAIDQLLSSPIAEHRCIALNLLSAIISVDARMSNYILTAFSMLSDIRKIILGLLSFDSERNEQITIRKCFIKFVLTFLVSGNLLLIRNFMNSRELAQALLFGLVNDDHTTICLVLNTLKKYVLENNKISKDEKVHIFGLGCCHRLLLLYDWSDQDAKETDDNMTSIKEKRETVANEAHKFLMTLLSSHKHGIVFNVSNKLRQLHNNDIQDNIIGLLNKPWNCKRKTELIISILKACPDLGRHTTCRFSNILNAPSTTDDADFIAIANFLRDIISTLHPVLLGDEFKETTFMDMTSLIKDICFPYETLVSLNSKNILFHENYECRLAIHQLLLTMFKQYLKFMDHAAQREQKNREEISLYDLKLNLSNHIQTYFPSINDIMDSIDLTSNENTKTDKKPTSKHLNVTLDLILLMCKQNRAIVKQINCEIILVNLQSLLENYENRGGDGDSDKNNMILTAYEDKELELKVVKTILLLNPNALEPQQKFFTYALKSLMRDFISGKDDLRRDSGNLLKDIFKNTGIFGRWTLEIDLWLEALRYSNAVTVDDLIKVLKIKNYKAEIKENKNFFISKMFSLMLDNIENVKRPNDYIKLVCMLLLHYNTIPTYIATLYEMKLKKLPKYMRVWLSTGPYPLESKTLELPKICHQIPFFNDLQKALLTGYKNNITFENIFGNKIKNMYFEIEIDGKIYKLHKKLKNERLVTIYIQQVIFVVMKLLKANQLAHQQASFGAECIKICLAIIQDIEKDKSLSAAAYDNDYDNDDIEESLLCRTLTYMFDIRFNAMDNWIARNAPCLHFLHFTSVILECCLKWPGCFNHLKNFRYKMINAFAIKIKTIHKTSLQSSAYYFRLIKVLQWSTLNCLSLLKLICKTFTYKDFLIQNDENERPQQNFYYDLLIYLLKRLYELQQSIQSEEVVTDISKFYVQFILHVSNDVKLEDFEKAFYDFLCIESEYIQCIDAKLFSYLFIRSKISEPSLKLACLLLKNHNNIKEQFLGLLPNHISKTEWLFPLLEIAFNKNINIPSTILLTIYRKHGPEISKIILNPIKANIIYKEHVVACISLIKFCMPITKCKELCSKRFRMRLKENCEISQIRLIHVVYEKIWNSLREHEIDDFAVTFINYLSQQIQLLNNDMKRKSLSVKKLELFVCQIELWFGKIKEFPIVTDYDFEIIFRNQYWLNFCKSCVRLGMQTDNITEYIDTQYGLLLKLMAYLCDKFYKYHGGTLLESKESNVDQNEPAQIFSIIRTHPKYYDILLSSNLIKIKTTILYLVVTLAKKSPTSILPHLKIPVILSAFNGKDNQESDNYIMSLLDLCELYNPLGLTKYQPLIRRLRSLRKVATNRRESHSKTQLQRFLRNLLGITV